MCITTCKATPSSFSISAGLAVVLDFPVFSSSESTLEEGFHCGLSHGSRRLAGMNIATLLDDILWPVPEYL